MKKILVVISSLLLVIACFSQSSHHVSTNQGLHTNMLSTILRDSKNYMWVSSYNGLHKFEGYRIKVYLQQGTEGSSLSSNEMHSLLEDKQGFIWTGTTNGLDKLDPVSGKIIPYTLKPPDSSSSAIGYIYSLFQDDENYIWASTDAALFRINTKSGDYTAIPVSKKGNGVPSYVTGFKGGVSTKKGVWMHTLTGIIFYEYKSRQFFHRFHNPENKPIFSLSTDSIYVGANTNIITDADANLYFITNNTQLIKYNPDTEKMDSFLFKRPDNAWNCCYSLAIDYRNNVWLGFRHGGILLFNSSTQQFTSIKFQSNNSLISSNYISSLQEDYLGQMWVTTDKGLDIVDYYQQAIQTKQLSVEPDFVNLKYGTGNMSVSTAGNLFIPCAAGGLMQVNTFSNEIQHFKLADSTAERFLYVYEDDEAGLLGAVNGTMYKLKIRNKNLFFESQNTAYAKALSRYRGAVVWMYKENSKSVYFKKENGNLYHYNGSDSLEIIKGHGFKQLACISADKKYLYYIDNKLNLVQRNLQTRVSTLILLNKKIKELNFQFAVPRAMVEVGDNNIWITSQNGLLRYEAKTETLHAYTTKDGLSHNFTFSLAVDDKRRLWAGSLGGVDWYNKETNRFQNAVSYSSGTYMDAFGSSLQVSNNVLYFSAGNNLFRIASDSFFSQQVKEKQLKLNDVFVNGISVAGEKNKPLQDLSYRANRIEFRFNLLSFDFKTQVRYYYFLEGLENEWIETTRPEISYNSLPPGSYIFRVKAVDFTGTEIKEQLSLPFIINPPFWQTWWFRVLVISLLTFFIFAIFRTRMRSFKTKAAIKQQMAELEAKAIRAQMNPHFIFNSLNAIQELIITENYTASYEYLSKFSKLLRLVLNNSEKNLIPLRNEIEMNQLYLELESLRFKQSFSYSIVIDEKIDSDTVLFPSLLVQPFLENAIWHGLMHKNGEKKLTLSFKEENKYLHCLVEDNGIGRIKAGAIKMKKLGAHHFDSKGTELALQRIKMLQQSGIAGADIITSDVYDNDGQATGTKVEIRIPLPITLPS